MFWRGKGLFFIKAEGDVCLFELGSLFLSFVKLDYDIIVKPMLLLLSY